MANNQVNGEEAVTTSQRLPEFTAAEPELWFALVESQFRMNGILSNQERYIKVVVALPSRYTTEVRDIIKQPITADSYGTLKEQLIKRVRTSEEKKLCELLANVKIGDEKPSHYLRRLQYFAVMFFPEQLLKTMWLRSLPKKYQTVLEMQLDRSVTAMAEVADAIYSVLPTCPMVAEASISQEEQLMHQIQQLRLEVAKLKSEVSKITSSQRGRSQTPHRGQPRRRSRSRSRPRGPRPLDICWYHWIFSEKADKCTKPCNWTWGKFQD